MSEQEQRIKKVVTEFLTDSRSHCDELAKLENLFTGAVKLAGLVMAEVIEESGLSKDYFYRRRGSGELTPADFLKLLDSFEKKYNDKTDKKN